MLTSTFRTMACITAMLTASCACVGASFRNGQSLYGEPVPDEAVALVVNVESKAGIRVDYDQTIRFVHHGKAFAWRFDGLDRRALHLSDIAPADFGGADVVIHVQANPLQRH